MEIVTDINLNIEIDAFIAHVYKILNGETDGPIVFWVDLFCGAGGTSSGIHLSGNKRTFVAACVNHDTNAILSHKENHPNTLHFIEDIRNFNVVVKIGKLIARLRAEFPEAVVNIWASLECTNFSKAKGGQARDADSRTLAEHMFMYLEHICPDYFWVENVREFMSWGPLDAKGKPESRTAGRDYLKWVENIRTYDFAFDWQILNSADFGAYQSRERLFLQFAKPGMPLKWPEPTHAKVNSKANKKQTDLFDSLGSRQPWKPVKEILDLSDEGESIFSRKKALSDNTLKRIYAGLIKFVANGQNTFTKQYNSGKDSSRVKSLNEPVGTITTGNSHAIVNSIFIKKYYSGRPEGKVIGIDGPAGTVKCVDGQALVTANHFISQRNNGEPKSKIVDVNGPARTITATGGNQDVVTVTHLNTYYGNGGVHDINEPSPTVTTKDRITKVDVKFIDQQYGNSSPSSINSPANTVTINPKFALISSEQFIMNQYTGGGQHTDINGPSGTVTSVPKQNLVSCEPWIMDTNFGNTGRSIDEPASTLLACRKYPYLINANSSTSSPNNIVSPCPTITSGRTHLLINAERFILNPAWGGNNGSVEEPCCTVVARQDKAPLYVVNAETNDCFEINVTNFFQDHDYVLIEDVENNTFGPRLEKSVRLQIIEFMAMYGISDIKMRMLKIPELKQIQGFPIDYKLKGTQTEQKKYIGNAVEVTLAKALATNNYTNIIHHRRQQRLLAAKQ